MGTAPFHDSSFCVSTTADGGPRVGHEPHRTEIAASRHRTNRPSPLQPTAQVDPEPQHSPVSDADKMVARERREKLSQSVTGEDVSRLAEVLREAKQAHSASVAELCQADADPVEDWAVWYAQYLLGVR